MLDLKYNETISLRTPHIALQWRHFTFTSVPLLSLTFICHHALWMLCCRLFLPLHEIVELVNLRVQLPWETVKCYLALWVTGVLLCSQVLFTPGDSRENLCAKLLQLLSVLQTVVLRANGVHTTTKGDQVSFQLLNQLQRETIFIVATAKAVIREPFDVSAIDRVKRQ